jgi:syntaxin 16
LKASKESILKIKKIILIVSRKYLNEEYQLLKKKKQEYSQNYTTTDLEVEEFEQNLVKEGLSDEKIKQIMQNNRLLKQRDVELDKILSSILELNEMFKESNRLIVIQGSMLDRIDLNIEKTQDFVSETKKELIEAEKVQSGSHYLICMIFLVIIIAGVIFSLFLKIFL